MEGRTLAQVARQRGKTVDGLVAAMVTAAKKDLADAVAAKRVTDAERDRIVAGLDVHMRSLVTGAFRHEHGWRDRDGDGPFGAEGGGAFLPAPGRAA